MNDSPILVFGASAIVTLGVFDDSVDLTGVDDKTNR